MLAFGFWGAVQMIPGVAWFHQRNGYGIGGQTDQLWERFYMVWMVYKDFLHLWAYKIYKLAS